MNIIKFERDKYNILLLLKINSMIQELTWHTKKISNAFFSDIHFRVHFGRKYHLTYNGSNGYVIYKDQIIKENLNSAHAELGEVQLFLKKEGTFFKTSLNIYDAKTNCYIGKLNSDGFIINQKQYIIRRTKKSIFNRYLPFDLIFEVNDIYSNMVLLMNIDRVNKKWYRTYYMDELKGSVQFHNNTTNEIILATFFCLHDEIQTLNSG